MIVQLITALFLFPENANSLVWIGMFMRFKNILTISAVLLSSFFYVRIFSQTVLIEVFVGHSASVKSLDFHPNDKIWDACTGQKII